LSEECRNDPKLNPVIFIHGHSLLRNTADPLLLDIFNKIQYQLQDDGYINAGTIVFDANKSEHKKNEWGLAGFPITVKASYYYDYFYSLGNFIYIARKADNLDTYAIRLKEIIDLIKYKTGKQINSRALVADSKETLACAFLSVALLLGLGTNYLFGFWQADPIVGLIIVAFLFREGLESWKESQEEDSKVE